MIQLAYTKIIALRASLNKAVNYVLNEEKTDLANAVQYAMNPNKNESRLFEGAVGCSVETAYNDMMETKKQFSNTGGIVGYHIIQSFAPGEVTPQQAFNVAEEFVRRYLADRYETIWSTHLDRSHYHSHIVFNSVSWKDGKKYRSNAKEYYTEIRSISDSICKEYGLSVITPNKDNLSLTYIEWLGLKQGKTTWQTIIRSDIDHAISTSYSFGEFLMDMEHMGYEIKQGKYLAFRPYGKERYSRCYKLGMGYSEDEIRDRIAGVKTKYIPPLKMTEYKKKVYAKVPFMPNYIREYWRWIYSLNLTKKRQAPRRVSKYLKKDLQDIQKHKEQFRFQKAHNIDSEEKFYDYVSQLDGKISEQYSKLRTFDNANKGKKKIYSALADIEKHKKPYELYLQGYTMMKKEHDAYIKAQKTLSDNGYTTPENIDTLKKEKVQLYEQRDEIKKDIRTLKKDKRICDDIEKTMEYIRERTRLIEQQKAVSKQKERNKNNDTHKRT